MHQVYNSPLVEAAKNYEFVKCEKKHDHGYYQLNQICMIDKCSYQMTPLCNLDTKEKLYGNHQHKTRDLKMTLQIAAEECVKNQIKYATEKDMLDPVELERMFLIAKDFRKIGESALNISEYLMEIVNGTHGAKGLETLLWDIFLCKKEESLQELLKRLRKHIREDRGEIVMREYKNPKNIVEKVNAKKQQIEDEIVNLSHALKLEMQELKARAEFLKPKGQGRSKELYDTKDEFQLAFDRANTKKQNSMTKEQIKANQIPKKHEFVKSIVHGKNIKEKGNKVFEGSGSKQELIYSSKPFSKGMHEFGIKVEKFNKPGGHVYIILLKEEAKEKGGNFFSPYHCIQCQDGYDMTAHPQKTSNFGPSLQEGSVITAKIDIESNIFEIRDQGSTVYYTNNADLYGETWRFAVWWANSHMRIKIF